MVIKIHINTLLLIILALFMLVISIVLIRISIQIGNNKNAASQNTLFDFLKFQQTNHSSSLGQPIIQSDFFKKSIAHAENVIKGIIGADEYAKEDRQGSDVIRRFMYLTDAEKKSLLTSINYYQSDPMIYSEAEKEFRRISSQRMIPLWVAILDDAMNKNIDQVNPSLGLKVA